MAKIGAHGDKTPLFWGKRMGLKSEFQENSLWFKCPREANQKVTSFLRHVRKKYFRISQIMLKLKRLVQLYFVLDCFMQKCTIV